MKIFSRISEEREPGLLVRLCFGLPRKPRRPRGRCNSGYDTDGHWPNRGCRHLQGALWSGPRSRQEFPWYEPFCYLDRHLLNLPGSKPMVSMMNKRATIRMNGFTVRADGSRHMRHGVMSSQRPSKSCGNLPATGMDVI